MASLDSAAFKESSKKFVASSRSYEDHQLQSKFSNRPFDMNIALTLKTADKQIDSPVNVIIVSVKKVALCLDRLEALDVHHLAKMRPLVSKMIKPIQ
jgi:hypothetical protein